MTETSAIAGKARDGVRTRGLRLGKEVKRGDGKNETASEQDNRSDTPSAVQADLTRAARAEFGALDLGPVDMEALISRAQDAFARRGVRVMNGRTGSVIERFWTRERLIARIQEWDRRFGRPPRSTEWDRKHARDRGYIDAIEVLERDHPYWPHPSTVHNLFGGWSAAILAAGLEPGRPGPRTPLVEVAA